MRVLLVHTETQFFAGAQKVLGYFLEEIVRSNCEVALAMAENSKLTHLVPPGIQICPLTSNQSFSWRGFRKQLGELKRFQKQYSANVLHGWTARDWELTSMAGFFLRRPAVGTLHDHPEAAFISPARQKLMRGTAFFGLKRIVCVSDAVRLACKKAGYPSSKLSVIRNGLPQGIDFPTGKPSGVVRLGFLGAFSERKGFRGLFEILDNLGHNSRFEWEICLAGAVQSAETEGLLDRIREQYSKSWWWKKVHWKGWTDRPLDFLASIDVLICPSSEFDPLPTVLLEAGKVGIPAVAARVGGVGEIVQHGKTGWIFEPGDWSGAANVLQGLIEKRDELHAVGKAAQRRIDDEFTARRMVDDYLNLFETII